MYVYDNNRITLNSQMYLLLNKSYRMVHWVRHLFLQALEVEAVYLAFTIFIGCT